MMLPSLTPVALDDEGATERPRLVRYHHSPRSRTAVRSLGDPRTQRPSSATLGAAIERQARGIRSAWVSDAQSERDYLVDAHSVAERQLEAASSRLQEWEAAVRASAHRRASRQERLAQLESRGDELFQSKVDALSRLVDAADDALERGDASRMLDSLAEVRAATPPARLFPASLMLRQACAQTRRLVRHLDAT